MKTIGIIGCGAIGTALAGYAERELAPFVSGMVLYDRESEKARTLAGKLTKARPAGSMEEAVDKADIVIETASAGAAAGILKEAIKKQKDIMMLSIGGLVASAPLFEEAREKGIRLMLPSGAIAGIDAVKAARIAGIESVTLTTRKPLASIKGAPYLLKKGIDVDKIKEETVIFEGTAREAIEGFPRNINVSVLLSLVGEGPDKTKVKIIVSPEYTRNMHEIEVKSKAGTIKTRTENVSFPENPKTSYLAALSAMVVLKGYFDTVQIGT